MKVQHSNSLIISNIQRFSLHDGPGIRTTVFIKGCSLHCPWCANPENISAEIENYIDSDNSVKQYGVSMSIEDIYEEVIKDAPFYLDGGGITLSGGEPLLRINIFIPLIEKLHAQNISVCAETALFIPEAFLELAIKYIDIFYVDIKILSKWKCKSVLNGDIELYKRNVEQLCKSNKNITFRLPIIPSFTNDLDNLETIIELLKKNNIYYIELIKGHNLAEKKYKSLNKKMYNSCISDLELKNIQNLFLGKGIETIICKI